MAFCDICGKYAWFRERHPGCEPQHRSGPLGLGSLPDPSGVAPWVRVPPTKPNVVVVPTDGTYAASDRTLNAVAAAAPTGIRSIGVSLNRKGPNAQRITRSIPEMQMIVGRELRRGHIDDLLTGPLVTAKLLDASTILAGERNFIRWCQSDDAPAGVRMFKMERLRLMFWAARELESSADRLEQLLDPDMAGAFPYFQLDAYACLLPSHAALDQFTALRDDQIWECLWPPNDWLCRCAVSPLLEADVTDTVTARKPGIARLSSDVWTKCADWYVRSPRNAIKQNPWW